ncbi:MAG TPA: hypothetical protein VHC22_01775 [Pirellulales bacterium]|nr:hypothetical protein [Pirellulales bacterium]
MTITRNSYGDNNVGRLNAFLDQFPESCDPDFDDQGEQLDRQLAAIRHSFADVESGASV